MRDTTATRAAAAVVQDPVAALLPAEFRAFYELYRSELLRYALARTGQRADAEDAVETAMARVYQIWDDVLRHEEPLALVYKVLHGKIIDARRRTGRDVSVDFAAPGAPDPPDPGGDIADQAAALADLDRALAALPHRQGACAQLHYLLGLDVAEVAARMGITASAVRSHLHEARKHLAAALGLPDTGHGAPRRARRVNPASSRKENAT